MRKKILKQKKITVTLMFLLLVFGCVFAQKSECVSGDCVNGHGEMRWSKKEIYIGWFKNGLREGYGYITYENGDSYIGEWSENLRHGHGVHTYNSHNSRIRYAGEWKNNNIEGYGTMHQRIGGFKTGYWNKNQFVPISKRKTCIEGDCENGWGAFIAQDGGFYVGEFKNSLPHGKGTIIYKMGTKYKGSFVEGKKEGFGVYYYLGGKKYEGGWKNDEKDGDGKFFSEGTLESIVVHRTSTIVKKEKPTWQDVQLVGKATDDKTAPTITILSPKAIRRGPVIVTKKKKLRVHGMAKDISGVKSIRVNGVEAALGEANGESRTFEASFSLSEGQNEFWVEATDIKGNKVKIDFTVKLEEGEEEVIAGDDKIEALPTEAGVVKRIAAKVSFSEKRMALVIGNSTYKISPLRNPVNDAVAMSDKLAALGFDVTVLLNADKNQMIKSVRAFGKELKSSGAVGLFYYAGHGLQIEGQNYLVPIGAKIEKELDVGY